MENYNSFFQILESEEKKEFEILFEDKTTWYDTDQAGKQNWDKSKDKIAKFDKILKDFIEFQVDTQTNNDMYNLSYIIFPYINFQAYFENNTINRDISFENAIFQGVTFFTNISFICNANFKYTTFSNIVMFSDSIFQKNADFYNATFKSDATFLSATFKENAYFSFSKFEGDAIFASAKFYKTFNCLNTFIKKFFLMDDVIIHGIKFNGLVHGNASYLKVIGLNNNKVQPLNKNHFANKESARLIKAHFEKQNNITEANKYFV
ncbi:MAG: pentapeptide repeat-containing protein, partial [Sulfurovaceae bacterium]|nr:pentapeptide repeat-containing protein [Sulfurovaceae bacterium]